MPAEPTVEVLRGAAIAPVLEAVATLRIAVFREFPYLYDGDAAYERAYLQAYLESPRAVCAVARDGDRVVGASTGLPLVDEGEEFTRPFTARGIDPAGVFYCAESVVLPAYRGRGLGGRFFDAREDHARALGFAWAAFAAVDRAADDPRCPPGHRGNESLWRRRGYARQPGMGVTLAWRELGEAAASGKPLTFWLRRLEDAA